MLNQFKNWLQKNEGLTEPPLERPDELLRKDAEEGRSVGAMPTYSLPKKKNKHKQKNQKKN